MLQTHRAACCFISCSGEPVTGIKYAMVWGKDLSIFFHVSSVLDKYHSSRSLNVLLLSLLSYFTKFIKHTGQQIKLTVDSLKPETLSHTALFKQWKSLLVDIADGNYSGFRK